MESPKRPWFRSWFVLSIVVGCLSISVLQWARSTGSLNEFIDRALPKPYDPDEDKDIEGFITSRGFNFSRHEIITSDGYHIEFHRLWREDSVDRSSLPVVIGAHLLGTSNSYVMDPDGIAFAYAGADFDVWLVNNRGTRYGRKHKRLDPEKDHYDFYEFTIVEIGAIDLAEQIDYVLRETGHKKVNYVGVSQGGASLYALLSKKPAYNAKIAKASSYGGFRSFCYNNDIRYMVAALPYDIFGDYLFDLVSTRQVLDVDFSSCSRTAKLCEYLGVNFLGFESNYYLNFSRVGVYGKNFPAGSSLRNFMWYAQSRQIGCDGNMREFDHDYGLIPRLFTKLGLRASKNLKIYGTAEPPLLDAKNVNIDLKIYYSDGDVLITSKETFKVREDLNVPDGNLHRIPDWRFSHFNFVIRSRPHAIDEHSINYFRGIESPWNPESSEAA
ncbi:gastric triacylglycerol lipase [Galendromus occidentalis]|uniref:Gastric triacylglycerol lipase n=1 Tax=Galendromus occidentalis TaxID=34638 RepID=A0AAJ6VXZ3_9ACAR|nr:gastric triacylglycerol lipase [Galendromus occidentalis]